MIMSQDKGCRNKSNKLCMHFECPLGSSWGQHGPKSRPKALPQVSHYWSHVGSWRGLGGLLGFVGAQELIILGVDSDFY